MQEKLKALREQYEDLFAVCIDEAKDNGKKYAIERRSVYLEGARQAAAGLMWIDAEESNNAQ